MESYPGELLVGVFPLVFCVDSTLEKKEERSRSQFDKFLDSIAASSSVVDGGDIHGGGPMMQRVEEEQSDHDDDLLLNTGDSTQRRKTSGTRVSSSSSAGNANSMQDPSSPTPERQDGRRRNRSFIGARSPFSNRKPSSDRRGSKRNNTSQRRGSGDVAAGTVDSGSTSAASNTSGSASGGTGIVVPPAFAEALQQGQSFFQRTRIVSASARHGFPPSKDPTGKSNRVVAITGMKRGQQPPHRFPTPLQQRQTKKQAVRRLKTATEARPIDGILPRGWLEKHAAALPSVIVAVTQVHPPQQQIQARQDKILLESLERLRFSLAPKRRVDVKVVALVQEGVSPIMADQWSQGMIGKLPSFLDSDDYHKDSVPGDPESIITIVEARELRSDDRNTDEGPLSSTYDNPKSSPLPALNQSIRRSSLRYYKERSREVKGKLLRLKGPRAATKRSPVLMPLLIRYCFKTAIFYEFQWKQDKSLKYMVEAYRLVETYYYYLLYWKLQQESGTMADYSDGEDDDDDDMNLTETSKEELQLPVLETSEQVFDCGEGVEMSLPSTASTSTTSSLGDDYFPTKKPPIVADDMIHQCRAIGDWLNFKILQMCLVSHDRSGTIAASVQWQRHAKTFCCPRRSFLNTGAAPWLDWSYVAQQRLVVSQLLERYPPRNLGALGGNGVGDSYDEDLLRFSPWRTYEVAAEALLKAGYRVRAVVEKGGISSLPLQDKGSQEGSHRIRYVGDIDLEGFRPSFVVESRKSHIEQALNCSLRGISLYEKERGSLESAKTLIPWTRSGARLYYLAGGALLGLKRNVEAIPHLEKAVVLCKGWSFLESLVRRLLSACYDDLDGSDIVGPAKNDDDSRRARTSFLLETIFNSRMSSDEVEKALFKLRSLNGVDYGGDDGSNDQFLRWQCDFIDDRLGGSPPPPFSFALSFQTSTHGAAGDKVKVSIWIKSNLRYAVRVHRLSMMSFLGPLSVPFRDFPSNANQISDGEDFITIQPNEVIEFGSELTLPTDLPQNIPDMAIIAGGESKTTASASKTTPSRSRSSGFTAAGGTRYSIQDEIADNEQRVIPWSTRCLGGSSLFCEGMIVTFSLASSAATDTLVKIDIVTKQPEAQPNTRRTAFDENNYVSSAWNRPPSLPMSKGPRCLRLLSPIANMMVTNVTEGVTNGKVLEGTVNRIVLKFKAPNDETCKNIVIQGKSSSSLTFANGREKQISLPDGVTSCEDVEDMMNPRVRAPVLVKPEPSSKTFMTDFGYILPSGWALAFDDQGVGDGFNIVAPIIKAGEEIYACFDVYRPTSEPIRAHTKGNQAIVEEMTRLNDCKCETKIDFSIRYHQETIGVVKPAAHDARANNPVTIDHSVTVVWSSPMSIAFSSNANEAYPSGSRHPSNVVVEHMSPKKESPGDSEKEVILIDNGKVLTKGILDPISSTDGLNIEVDRVQFIDTESDNTNCKFQLLSSLDDNGTIFQGKPNNSCGTLRTGSKMSFAWMTEVGMDVEYREESLIAPIGTVSVHWQSPSIELPEDISFVRRDSFTGFHGPLQLERLAVSHFSGPLCHIESAPFEVMPENLPDTIKVATPFEVTYSIRNKTPIDQNIEILLHNSTSSGAESEKDIFLIGGFVSKTISLGPFESHSFSYTAVPMKVGKVDLPSLSSSSRRYNTWIIRESLDRRSIYVIP